MAAGWTFKTGMTNYWVRLTTYNTTYLPNPTIDLTAAGHHGVDPGQRAGREEPVGRRHLGVHDVGTPQHVLDPTGRQGVGQAPRVDRHRQS